MRVWGHEKQSEANVTDDFAANFAANFAADVKGHFTANFAADVTVNFAANVTVDFTANFPLISAAPPCTSTSAQAHIAGRRGEINPLPLPLSPSPASLPPGDSRPLPTHLTRLGEEGLAHLLGEGGGNGGRKSVGFEKPGSGQT